MGRSSDEKSSRRGREERDVDRKSTDDRKDRSRNRDHRDRDRHSRYKEEDDVHRSTRRELDDERNARDSKRSRSGRSYEYYDRKHKRERSDEITERERSHERCDYRHSKRENSSEMRADREGSREIGHDRSYKSHQRDDEYDADRVKVSDREYHTRNEKYEIKIRNYVVDGKHERERSHEPWSDREGSGYEDLRDDSSYHPYFSQASKRKERGETQDSGEIAVKRTKISDKVKEKEESNQRRQSGNGDVEHGNVMNESQDGNLPLKEKKNPHVMVRREPGILTFVTNKVSKQEVDEHVGDESGSAENGSTLEPLKILPSAVSPAIDGSLHSKVSSISNENRGVSVIGSHEVHGKSSTDGTSSDAGKRNLSLDAIAKAKKALQKQKELSEKLKKFPLLNRNQNSILEAVPSGAGILPLPPTDSTNLHAFSNIKKHSEGSIASIPGLANKQNIEAVKRAQELAAKMGFRQDPEFAPLINMFPGEVSVSTAVVDQKPPKAPVLRLDALGREIDEHGNLINIPKPNNLSTLKVNINKQKKEAFQILKPEVEIDPESNPHFDLRMGVDKTKLLRPKRMNFQFVEEGKWSRDAEIIKLKSQFGEAQAKELKLKQAQLAKAKAEPGINPNLIEVAERFVSREKPKDQIPEIEWWDVPFLKSGAYDMDITDDTIAPDVLKMEKITIYVEHPRPIEPPVEPMAPPPQPLKLTKKEQKKLRTQRRLAREKDRQEMIRQGLIEPPKPKVKMSNLMKVLGSEATQDPTRLEMEIRSAAAERERAHADRNIARKLTPAERREKKERKLFDELNMVETIVSVYKVKDLSHPQTRFKVDVNAQENRLTGCVVMLSDVSVVMVEGGCKSIKRYNKLMLRRINWSAATAENEEEEGEAEKAHNRCVLVWQGSVARPSFGRFTVHECRTDAAARKIFADAGVGHYWDLAVNWDDEHS